MPALAVHPPAAPQIICHPQKLEANGPSRSPTGLRCATGGPPPAQYAPPPHWFPLLMLSISAGLETAETMVMPAGAVVWIPTRSPWGAVLIGPWPRLPAMKLNPS